MGARLFMTCATGLLLAALIGSPAAADDRQICHEEQPARRPDDVKDWDSVIQACSRIISSRAVRGGQLADAYFVRGIQYEERRDYDRALEDFSAAIWLEPKSARYLFYRAHVYKYNKRDPDRALADLSEAIRLASDNALYLRSRGELYEGKRQWDNALADYRAALSVDPNDRPARDGVERLEPKVAVPASPPVVPAPPAAAATVAAATARLTVKALFEKHDLIGYFAPDCGEAVSERNPYVFLRVNGDYVQRDTMAGPTTHVGAEVIESAAEAGPGELTLSTAGEQGRFNLLWRVEPNRVRLIETRRDGEKPVSGGRFIGGPDKEVPWMNKCG